VFALFTTTAKEEILSPFPLCCADPTLASCMVNLEKPHQGVAPQNPALHQGITWSNSTTALGLRGARLENRIRSRCTGKERDTESGLDNFGARHYASSMGRWMVPDLVNVTEDRVVNPANTLNKYVYGGNNPLKYVDPDGRDITYFYDQGGIAGHAILFAYNQATGDSAIESFGPEYHLPIAPGESMYEMSSFTSADDLRDKLTSLTIQTTPELAQQVIDYIRANPDPALWVYAGPNCSSQVWKILQKFKLAHKNSRLDGRPGNTPRNLWGNLIQQNNPFHQGLNPKNGVDYGNNRFDMFNLMWLSLPQSQPKGTVTVTVTNCVTDDKGKKVCDTQ